LARRLIYVSIVHSQADLGSLATGIGAIEKKWLDAEERRRHQQEVAGFWERLKAGVPERVEKELAGAGWDRLRIYQDGLPGGGEMARRIVTEVAEKGSPNYQIVEGLLQRGARLEQTEDPALLREEYELIRQVATASGPAEAGPAQQAYRRRSRALLEERDRFIAKRIDESLKAGEVGLLFIGAYHRVVSYLPQDIEVIPVSWGAPLP